MLPEVDEFKELKERIGKNYDANGKLIGKGIFQRLDEQKRDL